MKTVLLIVLGLVVSTPMITAADDAVYEVVLGPVHESDGVVTYFLSSDFMNGECRVQILRSEKPTDRILYLLPVTPWPGFEEKWDRLGSGMSEIVKHDFHNRFGYTVVVPDFPEYMPWFVDHATDPKRRHESYMMTVLIPFIDRIMEIEDPIRDLAGFSKAGFGSLSLILRHPDVFHAASVWDPGGLLKPYSPEATKGLSQATGSKNQFDRYQLGTSIRENAAKFRGRKRIAISGYSNGTFLERLRALRDLLDQEGISYRYSESAQVPHRWYTGWMEQALDSLQQMSD
jgi:hypothetical protein